jgi:hypothetical protein
LNFLIRQLNAWRNRYRPPEAEQTEEALNRSFAFALTSPQGREVVDYLITTYYRPIEFIGVPSTIVLAERNGAQKVVIDILKRIDMAQHPMAYAESPSTEQPFDARL